MTSGMNRGAKIVTMPLFDPKAYVGILSKHKVGCGPGDGGKLFTVVYHILHPLPSVMHFLSAKSQASIPLPLRSCVIG